MREGTSGIMANGGALDDEKLTCASWDYPFGTKLFVTNLRNGKTVCVVVTDRGPSKSLYNHGRRLDLSKKAFATISELERGIEKVSIKEVK